MRSFLIRVLVTRRYSARRGISGGANRTWDTGRTVALLECVLPATSTLIAFALVCLGLVLTPGPNMMYLVSRSICQGRQAGLISLGGVGLGFLVYMLAAAFGITALLFAVPIAYDVLRLSGAAYLLYL